MARLAGRLLVLALAGCSARPEGGTQPAGGGAAATPSVAAPAPQKTAHGFDLQLTLTPRAAARLAGMGEKVTVNAMFYGDFKPGREPAEGADGVDLGEDMINVEPANARVVVTGAGFDPTRLGEVQGSPQVLVNVFTARLKHADNLIDCGVYQGPITMAQARPVDIKCDLIEPPGGDVQPG